MLITHTGFKPYFTCFIFVFTGLMLCFIGVMQVLVSYMQVLTVYCPLLGIAGWLPWIFPRCGVLALYISFQMFLRSTADHREDVRSCLKALSLMTK